MAMKNKKRILILSASSILVLASCNVSMFKKAEKAAIETSVMQDEVGKLDNIGMALPLRAPEVGSISMHQSLGFEAVNRENGLVSVRVFAAVDGYKSIASAKVIRSIVKADGTVVKEEDEKAITTVYASLGDAVHPAWVNDSAPAYASNYYLVYQLNNIPEEYFLDDFSVRFEVRDGLDNVVAAESVVNARGVLGEELVGVVINATPVKTAEENSVENGGDGFPTFSAMKADNYITEAVVPEDHYTITNFYAAYAGKVTALAAGGISDYNGAFESCTSLARLVLPDTIEVFDNWCFNMSSNKALTEFTFPRDLKSVGGNRALPNASGIKKINYNAINFVNGPSDPSTMSLAVDEVIVSADVESLPDNLFYQTTYAAYGPALVTYGGTTAEWNALKTEDNANNGLFIYNVVASDTVKISVNVHLGDAYLVNDSSKTGELVYSDKISGKTMENIGPAGLPGMKFMGWFLDASFETPFSFDDALPDHDIDVYPKFEPHGAGVDPEHAIEVSDLSSSVSAETAPGMNKVYFSYTATDVAEEGDWRYFHVANFETTPGYTAALVNPSNKINVYAGSYGEANLMELVENAAANKMDVAQREGGASSYTSVKLFVHEGDTFIFEYDPTSNNKDWYGTFDFSVVSIANDTLATAIEVNKNETVAVASPVSNKAYYHAIYKYESSADESLAFTATGHNGASGFFRIFDVADMSSGIAYGQVYGTGEDSVNAKQVAFEAGHTYMIDAYIEYNADTAVYMDFILGGELPGTSPTNPAPYSLGSEYTAKILGGSKEYLAMDLADETIVAFETTAYSSGSSEPISIVVYSGEDVVFEATAASATTNASKVIKLPAGSYLIAVGYESFIPAAGNTWKLKTTAKEEGSVVEYPIDYEDLEDLESVIAGHSSNDTHFYRYTAVETGYLVGYGEMSGYSSYVYIKAEEDSAYTTIANGSGMDYAFPVTAGTSYIIKVDGKVYTSRPFTMSFATSLPADGSSADRALEIASDGSKNMFSKYRSKVYTTFTVSSDATYRFYTRNNNYGYNALSSLYKVGEEASAFTEFTKQNMVPFTGDYASSFEYQYYNEVSLTAGTYILEVSLNSSYYSSLEVYVEPIKAEESKDNAIAVDLSGDSASIACGLGGYFYKYEVPATSQRYLKVSPSGVTKGKLDVYDGADNLLATIENNGSATLDLDGISEIYLKAYGAAGTFELAVEHSEGLIRDGASMNSAYIYENMDDSNMMNVSGKLFKERDTFIEVTVEVAGTYRVWSHSEYDLELRKLLDANGDKVSGTGKNDDRFDKGTGYIGNNMDFYYEYTLEPGTYYIQAYSYTNTATIADGALAIGFELVAE